MARAGQATLGSVQLELATVTECGPHRNENQDAVLAVPGCFAVADGMGGYEGGAYASSTTLAAIDAALGRAQGQGVVPETTEAEVNGALAQAQASIKAVAHGNPMGSTVTGAALSADGFGLHWLVWHVGDSRLYRFFRGEMSQVTVDHTVVNELVLTGQLRAWEAARHPDRHVITRAVGMSDSLPADFATLEVRAGEMLLLCSDGLTGTTDDSLIEAVLRTVDDLSSCARRLVDLAYETGSRDNTSVVLVRCISGPEGGLAQDGDDLEVTRPRPPQVDDDEAPGPGPSDGASLTTAVIKEVPE